MLRRLTLTVVLVSLALLAVPGRLVAQEFYRAQIEAGHLKERIGASWYGVYHDGRKIGYYQFKSQREKNELVESSISHMKVSSFGQKVEMTIRRSMVYESVAPYRLLRGTFEQSGGDKVVKISVTRNDKGYEHVVEAAGQKQVRQMADLGHTLASAIPVECWVRTGPKAGATILTNYLDIKDWKLEETLQTVAAIKKSIVGGVEVKYFEVESIKKKDMSKILSRYDSAGKVLSGNTTIFELRRETEEQAKNTEFSQDIFVLGMVKIDRPIGSTTKLTELVVEVTAKEEVFEPGPRQNVVKGERGVVLLKVGKAHGSEVKATAKEIEENLAETNAYAVSNAKVKAAAAKAIGNAKTPQQKLERIVAFAHDFIQPELTAYLPNIHDLLQDNRGDCKSYSLLVTNLCRASGIPAREVSGLLYMGDDQQAFGGHAWNEVVIDGRWVPVDASLGQTEVDAGHLCLGGGGRQSNKALSVFGKMSLRLVEAKTTK